MEKQGRLATRKLGILIAMLCFAVALWFSLSACSAEEAADPSALPEGSSGEDTAFEEYPVMDVPEDELDPYYTLFTTESRMGYQNGALRLVVPRISFDRPLEAGTSEEELERGPGLYEFAQLPGTGDRNVSIAGHRYLGTFYYAHTIVEGDYLYLVDAESIYRYVFETAYVVEPTDWSPICQQGFSCVTLTTCEPIGISDHRLIVVGRLDAILPYYDDFVFETSAAEQPERGEIFENAIQYWLRLHESRAAN